MIMTHVLNQLLGLGRTSQSVFQMDRFVIARNGMTPFGVLKQSHRELVGLWEGLKAQWIQHREAELAVEEIETKLANDPYGERERLVLARARMGLDTHARNFENSARLFLRCYQHGAWALAAIEKEHGQVTEALLDRLDVDDWKLQLRRRAAIESRLVGLVSESTVDMISSLANADREELAAFIDLGSRQALWEWLWAFKYPQPDAGYPTLDAKALYELVAHEVQQQSSLTERESAREPIPRLADARRVPIEVALS